MREQNCRFLVGRDRGGHWIADDLDGRGGGVFADRRSAMHYAVAECDYHPEEVQEMPDGALSIDSLFGNGSTTTRRPKWS